MTALRPPFVQLRSAHPLYVTFFSFITAPLGFENTSCCFSRWGCSGETVSCGVTSGVYIQALVLSLVLERIYTVPLLVIATAINISGYILMNIACTRVDGTSKLEICSCCGNYSRSDRGQCTRKKFCCFFTISPSFSPPFHTPLPNLYPHLPQHFASLRLRDRLHNANAPLNHLYRLSCPCTHASSRVSHRA
ncbi:hypothetical protein DEU56DRAFT_828789 [Suillus clintonianus]|uniref:uncharacterized protein n=1 Tax=Suillus clintonianus TaxID=1904413 RepID=UPI001B86C76B|nr:uncharacterized protein DEU56DRAFT_828789 [Suillus clintonianus]KAG2123808.1 hypothetical protein DEU56DRAFT_828789 [Suillus clintonianus]